MSLLKPELHVSRKNIHTCCAFLRPCMGPWSRFIKIHTLWSVGPKSPLSVA